MATNMAVMGPERPATSAVGCVRTPSRYSAPFVSNAEYRRQLPGFWDFPSQGVLITSRREAQVVLDTHLINGARECVQCGTVGPCRAREAAAALLVSDDVVARALEGVR
jgi:hypothetical protein